jgi:hypothetical protein
MLCRGRWLLPVGPAFAVMLLTVAPVSAQIRSSSTTAGGGSFGGGSTGGGGAFSTGGSVGGMTGTSSGGAFGTGSSAFGGSFTGGSSFIGGSSAAGVGVGRAGAVAAYGTTSLIGRYLGNPLAMNNPTVITQPLDQRPVWYNSTTPFGVPTFNITATTPVGTVTITTVVPQPVINSIGIRRAPAYTTGIAFDYTPRGPAAIRTDLQSVIARSSRLPSRDNIRVSMDGSTVVLSGRVATDRERRLADAIVRLTPGVQSVRNELQAPQAPPPKTP